MRLGLGLGPGFKVLIGYWTWSGFFLLLEEGFGHSSLAFKELTFVEREVLVPILHRVVNRPWDTLVQITLKLSKVLVWRLVLLP